MRRSTILPLFVPLALAACDAPVAPASTSDDGLRIDQALSAAWTGAVSIDPAGTLLVNTVALEGCPHESPDGRSLFFASDRDGPIDIWVSHRQGNGPWGEPQKLPAPINSTANDFCPTPLPGGWLMFVSTRSDGHNCGSGTADIYESRLHPSQGWSEPRHLGCVINSPGNEFSPSYVDAGGGMLFFSSDRSGRHVLYVSRRQPEGTWQTPQPIEELDAAGFNSFRPNVSQDGREIVFDSNRPGGAGGLDIWYSRRSTPNATWSAPVNAGGGVNSIANESRASFSRDGRRLYFGSTREGSLGSSDLFVARR